MDPFPDLPRIERFDWDRANVQKNWDRHRVAFYECEEVLLRGPVLLPDLWHLGRGESRFFALGKTVRERLLTVVFTVRDNKVRVISARDMSRKERKVYGQEKGSSQV